MMTSVDEWGEDPKGKKQKSMKALFPSVFCLLCVWVSVELVKTVRVYGQVRLGQVRSGWVDSDGHLFVWLCMLDRTFVGSVISLFFGLSAKTGRLRWQAFLLFSLFLNFFSHHVVFFRKRGRARTSLYSKLIDWFG